MLNDLVKARIDDKKPRREGLTYIVDKLQGIDKDNFEILSPMIDVVKIYGAFPLLIPETTLERKIKFYHDVKLQKLKNIWLILNYTIYKINS